MYMEWIEMDIQNVEVKWVYIWFKDGSFICGTLVEEDKSTITVYFGYEMTITLFKSRMKEYKIKPKK